MCVGDVRLRGCRIPISHAPQEAASSAAAATVTHMRSHCGPLICTKITKIPKKISKKNKKMIMANAVCHGLLWSSRATALATCGYALEEGRRRSYMLVGS